MVPIANSLNNKKKCTFFGHMKVTCRGKRQAIDLLFLLRQVVELRVSMFLYVRRLHPAAIARDNLSFSERAAQIAQQVCGRGKAVCMCVSAAFVAAHLNAHRVRIQLHACNATNKIQTVIWSHICEEDMFARIKLETCDGAVAFFKTSWTALLHLTYINVIERV